MENKKDDVLYIGGPGKKQHIEQFQDMIGRLYPETYNETDGNRILSRTVTWQVTDRCNLACTYCYQINKSVRRMRLEDGKKFVDMLLDGDERINGYINVANSPAIVLEFIGGEPFLEVELIDQIVDYFKLQCVLRRHPWATKHMISISSNGILYFDPKVQNFLMKNRNNMSLSISIDGNKELHDSCRVFPDGVTGSYDIAVAAAKDWMAKGHYMGSKITIAPGNVQYLYSAIVHMIELGYNEINANVVYEKGWELEHAIEYYKQLKQIADYFFDNSLFQNTFCSLFEENFFRPKSPEENDNWCGGTGLMLSMDPDGRLFPCIRYMESSLGDDRPPLNIGHIDTGVGDTEECKNRIKCLQCITRRSQSTDECFNCPIAEGCSWCSAYNYQEFGTPDHRATYICIMHQARSLANVYFWNKFYHLTNQNKVFELNCPDHWASKIIDENELNMLKNLARPKNQNTIVANKCN